MDGHYNYSRSHEALGGITSDLYKRLNCGDIKNSGEFAISPQELLIKSRRTNKCSFLVGDKSFYYGGEISQALAGNC